MFFTEGGQGSRFWPKETVFTSENISETFNAPIELNKTERGYRLEFLGSPRDFGI